MKTKMQVLEVLARCLCGSTVRIEYWLYPTICLARCVCPSCSRRSRDAWSRHPRSAQKHAQQNFIRRCGAERGAMPRVT